MDTINTFDYVTTVDAMIGQHGAGVLAMGRGNGQSTAYLLAHTVAYLRGEAVTADGKAFDTQKAFAKTTGWGAPSISKAITIVKQTPMLAALCAKSRGKYVADGAEIVATVVAFVEPLAATNASGIHTIYQTMNKPEDEDEEKVYVLDEDVARLYKRALKNGKSVAEVIAAVIACGEGL